MAFALHGSEIRPNEPLEGPTYRQTARASKPTLSIQWRSIVKDALDQVIWELLYCLLRHHQKIGRDASASDVLDRLFHEYVPQAQHVRLTEENCHARMEAWFTDKLARVKRKHDGKEPRHENCPVVVLSYEGCDYLIDGNNRVNKWVEDNSQVSHNVVIVKYKRTDT